VTAEAVLKFSEDQPRIPAGSPEGGEWASSGASEVAADRNRMIAEFAKMSVTQVGAIVEARTGTKVITGGRAVRSAPFRRAMAQYIALQARFPLPIKSISVEPAVVPWHPGSGGEIARYEGDTWKRSGDMILAAKYWVAQDPDALPISGGYHPPGTDNAIGYLTHEYGHALDHAMTWWDSDSQSFQDSTNTRTQRPSDPAVAAWHEINAGPSPSRYGDTGTNEKFAEAFSYVYAGAGVDSEYGPTLERLTGTVWPQAAKILKYDPSQPRDDHGRWTTDGAADTSGLHREVDEYMAQHPGMSRIAAARQVVLARQGGVLKMPPKMSVEAFRATNATRSQYFPRSSSNEFKSDNALMALAEVARLNDEFHVSQYNGKWIGPNPYITQMDESHAAEQRGAGLALSERFFGKSAMPFFETSGGFHPAGTWNPAGVTAHEYGHWLDRMMGGMGLLGAANISGDYLAWREQLQHEPPISGYAGTDDRERVAETFAAAFGFGSQATEEPQAVSLREVLTKIGVYNPPTVTKFDPSEPRDDHGRWTADEGLGIHEPTLPEVMQDAFAPVDPAAATALNAHGYPNAQVELNGDPALVGRVVNEYERLASRFPATAAQINSISVRPGSQEVLKGMAGAGIAATNRNGEQIAINPYWMAHPAEMQDMFEKAVEIGWFKPGTGTVEGVIDHEFGHSIFALNPDAKTLLTTMMANGARGEYSSPRDMPEGYSRTSPLEWWAELTTQALNVPREDQSRPAQMVGSYLQNLSEKQNGTADVVKFDPSQPRDDRGRWTTDGAFNADQRSPQGSAGTWDRMTVQPPWKDLPGALADLRSKYPDTEFDDSLLRGLPDRTLPALAMFDYLKTAFPGVRVTALDIADLPSNVDGRTSISPANETAIIHLGASVYVGGVDAWPTTPDVHGWFVSGCDNPAGTLAHEFGHCVMADAGFEAGWGNTTPEMDHLQAAFLSADQRDWGKISGYAATAAWTGGEGFAEAFNAVANPDSTAKDSPVVAAMRTFLDTTPSVLKFDESEPRDEAGRWTDSGGLAQTVAAYRAKYPGFPASSQTLPGSLTADGQEHTVEYPATPSAGDGILHGDPARCREALLALVNLQERFPGIVKQIDVRDLSQGWGSKGGPEVEAISVGQSIFLSDRWFGANPLEGFSGQSGYMVQDTVLGTITHEFGHALDYELATAFPEHGYTGPGDAYRAWRTDYVDNGRPVSGYARTDEREKIAEAFTSAVLGGQGSRDPGVVALRDALAADFPGSITKRDVSDEPRDDAGKWTDGGAAPALDRLGMETVVPGARFKPEGINPEYYPMIRSTLREFAQRFPEIAAKAGGVKVWAASNLAPGTQAQTLGNVVKLSSQWFTGPASAWPTKEQAGDFSVDPSAEGTLIHELGHVVDANRGMADGSYYPSYDVIASYGLLDPQYAVSGYAATGAEEAFAEAFTAWWEGSHADNMQVQAVTNYLASEYGLKKAEKADTVSPLVFTDEMVKLLTEAYKEAFTEGWDDSDTETELTDNTIDDMLDQEVPDLNQQVTSLAALLIGGAVSGAMLVARLGQWSQALNAIYEKGFAAGIRTMGDINRVTWVTEEDGVVCPLCDDRDGRTWLSDEKHPYPGEGYYGQVCEGGPNCRCSLTYELVAEVGEGGDDEGSYDEPYDTTEAAAVPDLTVLSVPELLRMRQALKYDESEPRDDRGRWSSEPGTVQGAMVEGHTSTGWPGRVFPAGYYYHGTLASRLEAIRQHGIRAQPYGWEGQTPRPVVFFSEANKPMGAEGHAYDPERGYAGGALLRIPTDAPGVRFSSDLMDIVAEGDVPPSLLELWGADGQWHPLAPAPDLSKYSTAELLALRVVAAA
jgi:hypothetical protein